MGEYKAQRYITGSGGKISTVIWIDVKYRDAEWATVSLLVAGSQPGSVRWVCRQKTLQESKLRRNQPAGEIGLYASDFLTRAGLPLALCRPTDEELEVGLSRPAYVTPHFSLPSSVYCDPVHLLPPTFLCYSRPFYCRILLPIPTLDIELTVILSD